jgi:hypothetical protein
VSERSQGLDEAELIARRGCWREELAAAEELKHRELSRAATTRVDGQQAQAAYWD